MVQSLCEEENIVHKPTPAERTRAYRERKSLGLPRLKPGPKPRAGSADGKRTRKVVQNAAYYRRYRAQRTAAGRKIRDSRHIDAEAPGLKPPLTAEYHKCGFPEPADSNDLIKLFQGDANSGFIYFWRTRRGLPADVPIPGANPIGAGNGLCFGKHTGRGYIAEDYININATEEEVAA